VRRSLVVVSVSVIGAGFVAYAFLPKMEYLPSGNRNLVFGLVLPPPGYSIEELQATGAQNQKVMVEHTGKVVGGVPSVHRSFFVGDPSLLIVGAVASDPEQVTGVRDFMRDLHARIPGSIGFASQAALFSRGIGEGRAVELEISGRDLSALVGVGRRLMGPLSETIAGSRVRPVPVLDDGAPEFHILPNRAQAARLGFSPRDVALIADAYVDGAIIGEFGREGERKLDVVLTADGAERLVTDEPSLLATPVATPGGELVPFSVLGAIETRLGPTSIQRIERVRSVVLQVTPPDDVPFQTAVERVSAAVESARAEGIVPAGVELSLGGSAGKLVQAQSEFGFILLVALVISFLLLAGLFEDFVAPVVVLVTIPLAAAGGVLALWAVNRWLTPQPLDLMSALGFLILIGVVVNNAILIVDGALARLREGTELADAVSEAVRARVRPIFMSTFTSLAGLLPMVLRTGDGSELYRGVGTIVLGGLALSTFLSLFVVPSLFALLWRGRRAVMRAAEATLTRYARPTTGE
jgi:HAE1 family hydrophobic/amphiphilic exporter-1